MGLISLLLDVLFPPKCVFCGEILPRKEGRICEKCKSELPYTGSHPSQKGDFFSVCVAPLYYEDEVRESLIRYKFGGAPGYGAVYGALLAECISGELEGRWDILTWVPLSAKRYKERGYDQAKLLTDAVGAKLGVKPISTLRKVKHIPKQATMGSPEKRRANISGAYIVSNREAVEGKRILLIDDIITSGSTLGECARMLRQSGAAEVVCAAVARSRD
ncbi:MAG: ComF family protein [Oscillospiraceae bacterium]|nr:ComF family protein [Oscillospiraceae bacterium]